MVLQLCVVKLLNAKKQQSMVHLPHFLVLLAKYWCNSTQVPRTRTLLVQHADSFFFLCYIFFPSSLAVLYSIFGIMFSYSFHYVGLLFLIKKETQTGLLTSLFKVMTQLISATPYAHVPTHFFLFIFCFPSKSK